MRVTRSHKSPGEQFWFPVDRVFDANRNAVKFRAEIKGYFFRRYADDIMGFLDENPHVLTAETVSLHTIRGKIDMAGMERQDVEGDHAIAVMLTPLIIDVPRQATEALKTNLLLARDWFFWPHGQSDKQLFWLSKIYSENDELNGPKELFVPRWVGSPVRYLELKYSEEYAGRRNEAKGEALGIARQFLEKAHEIYDRYVPKALESRWGETRWQLPKPPEARAA